MIARRPVCLSWQNTTCSWPVGSWPSAVVKTPMEAPVSESRTPAVVGRAVVAGGGAAGPIYEPSAHRPGGPAVAAIRPPCGQPPYGEVQSNRETWHDRGVPSLFASYLRVYEPLTAFDRERQVFWRRYVREGRAVAPAEGPGRQRTAVLEALGASWTRLPELPEEAYVLEADETLLICPWNLRIRVAEAALTARDGVPSVLADAFVPPLFAGLAKSVLDDWRSGSRVLERGLPRVHEQVATWGVPLRWFVFVDLSERELTL